MLPATHPAPRRVLRVALLALAGAALARAEQTPRPRPVAVVCWDGASWPLLAPLVEAHRLPALEALLRRGRAARLATFDPALAAPVATTIATGLAPEVHGVADASELDPSYARLRAASALSRAVPALWNVASARGLSVAVVGWPATWPAESVNGTILSDRLLDGSAPRGFPALAFPEAAKDATSRLAPRGRASGALGDLVDRARVRFAAATELAARADLTMLYTGETAEAARLLYDPRTPDPGDAHALPPEVERLFVETDRLLGTFAAQLEHRGGDLFVLSAAGLKWAPPRRGGAAPNQRTADGILVAAGPDVIASRVRTQASVFDVLPTVAQILSVPLDPRATGAPLRSWISAGIPPAPPKRRWDEVVVVRRGPSGLEPATSARDSAEHARRLTALGYVVPTGPFTPLRDAPLRSPAADANVALFLRAQGNLDGAVTRLKRAVTVAPRTPEYRELLADALEARGSFAEADDEVMEAARARGADGPAALVGRAQARIRAGKRAEALMLLMHARTRVAEPGKQISLAYGRLSLDVGHGKEALRIARLLVRARPKDPASWTLLADASDQTGAAGEAGRARAKASALAEGRP